MRRWERALLPLAEGDHAPRRPWYSTKAVFCLLVRNNNTTSVHVRQALDLSLRVPPSSLGCPYASSELISGSISRSGTGRTDATAASTSRAAVTLEVTANVISLMETPRFSTSRPYRLLQCCPERILRSELRHGRRSAIVLNESDVLSSLEGRVVVTSGQLNSSLRKMNCFPWRHLHPLCSLLARKGN